MKSLWLAAAVITLVTRAGWAWTANSVVIESKTVVAGSRGVEVGIYLSNVPPVGLVHLPFVIRSVTPGAFIDDTVALVAGGRLLNSLATPGAAQYFAFPTDTLGYHGCYWIRSAPDYVSPDAVFYFSARGLILHQFCLPSGTDGSPAAQDHVNGAIPSLTLWFNVAGVPGIFEIDTACVGAEGLRFAECYGNTVFTPEFTKGTITVIPCDCACHGDPNCDGTTADIQDVINMIAVAFDGQSPVMDSSCPRERTDVDCSGSTDVQDVVKTIDVAFRGAEVAVKFCQPCQ